MSQMSSAKTIDEFIGSFPAETQEVLQKLRAVIKEVAPNAGEKISYGIPTFTLNGNLMHFSAYKTHIGFYPGSQAISVFKDPLASYETSKVTVRFPLDKPLPYDLIKKIVAYRVQQQKSK